MPIEWGGHGVSTLAYSLCLGRIAKADASTAVTFNMHANVQWFIARVATQAQQERYFGRVVGDQAVFASFGTELGTGSLARRVPGGVELSGVKDFCSLAGHADYYWVWTLTDEKGSRAERMVNCLVAADRQEITIEPTWDGLGMRATASERVLFDKCFVPEDDIAPTAGVLESGLVMGFALGYATIYVALAEAALEYLLGYLRRKKTRGGSVRPAYEPILGAEVAKLRIEVEAAQQLLYQAARAMAHPDPELRTLAVSQAKYLASEAALNVTTRALELYGGRSASRTVPLERYFRDARTTTLMPPTTDILLRNVGVTELRKPGPS